MKKLFSKYVAAVVIAVLLLATGVKIHSALAGSPGRDWNHRNLQKIDRARTEFSFAVFGDNQNSITVFNNLIKKLNADDIDFAVDNGDLVFDGEMQKYRLFVNQAKRLKKPLLTNIGNHDTYINGRENYYEIFGPYYYSFTIGQCYFIVMDNAREESLDPWQVRWLEGELEKSRNYRYRFVFMHIPLYDTREEGFGLAHGMNDRADARMLNRMFDRYGVTMVFASHIHEYERGVWGKTPYIITGGGGGGLSGTDPNRYFFHYIKVNVSDAGVDYEVVKLRSPPFNMLERLVYDTWIYIYAFLAVHYLDLVIVIAALYLLGFVIFTLERRRRGAGGSKLSGREADTEGGAGEDS